MAVRLPTIQEFFQALRKDPLPLFFGLVVGTVLGFVIGSIGKSSVKESLTIAEKTTENTQSVVEYLEKQKSGMLEDQAELNRELDDLSQENSSLAAKLEAAKLSAGNQQTSNAEHVVRLTQKLNALEERYSMTEQLRRQENASKDARIERLRSELQELQLEYQSVESELGELKTSLAGVGLDGIQGVTQKLDAFNELIDSSSPEVLPEEGAPVSHVSWDDDTCEFVFHLTDTSTCRYSGRFLFGKTGVSHSRWEANSLHVSYEQHKDEPTNVCTPARTKRKLHNNRFQVIFNFYFADSRTSALASAILAGIEYPAHCPRRY